MTVKRAATKTKTAIAKQGPTALDVAPVYEGEDRAEGLDHLTKDDVTMPRVALLQRMSPQCDEDDAAFVDGWKPGEFVNTLTETNYGSGPIRFVIVAAYAPKWIEFIPRSQGGGVKDMNVPKGDPRTQWIERVGEDGEKTSKPLAEKFYEYVILLPDHGREIVALSCKSTAIAAATKLNTKIATRKGNNGRRASVYLGVYTMESVADENSKGQKFKNFEFKNAGWIDPSESNELRDLHLQFVDAPPEVKREEGDTPVGDVVEPEWVTENDGNDNASAPDM